MKIDHLLHPELVLNRRGSKAVRSVYSELLNSIEILDDAGELRFYKDRLKLPYSIQLASFALANKPAMRAFEIWKRFKDHKGECFYLPKVFCNVLRSVESKRFL